ncbi:MAG: response regulator, partial [Anaerolineae bacterium]|nr:response regulator [Anaerolineae bacterium]
METLTFDRFVGDLRSALHYLYDPDQLRRSSLASLFGVSGFDAAAALQRILTDAVEALQPAADEPPQSRAWRIYDALVYRYVRRFERDVVADQLGISGRQLRREQRAALEVLADHLWKQYGLATKALKSLSEDALDAASVARASGEATQAKAEAPAWLRDLPPEKPAALRPVLQATLELARPLARQWTVHLQGVVPEELHDLPVPQVALRHALLSLLGIAIPRASGGSATVSAVLGDGMIEIAVCAAEPAAAGGPLTEREVESLDVARHLADAAGGGLIFDTELGARPFGARLTLPILERVSVLVVDDNADILQLFARYVSGSRYCLTVTHDPKQALGLAQTLEPPIIVLDVMMPEVDGWELLAQLRQQPETVDSAVIICTVLPQEALAL